MNPQHLHRTTAFALETLTETEEVFSALAGRLLRLAYHLEELGEAGVAERYRQLLDTDRIDDCLLKLRSLSEDLQEGKRFEIDFAIRAVAIYQKIDSLFDQERLQGLIPPPFNRLDPLYFIKLQASEIRAPCRDLNAS